MAAAGSGGTPDAPRLIRALSQARGGNRIRMLESVLANVGDAVLITDAEPINQPGPRILHCNAAFTAMTGYTEAELRGRSPRILQPPGADRAQLDLLRLALERREAAEVELLNVRKDGTRYWVKMSIVPVHDDFGTCTHWVSVQHDATARHQPEAAEAQASGTESRLLQAEVAERRRSEARLLHAAYHDSLTRLRNRASLMDHLRDVLERGRAGGPRCALLFLDLDGFKLVNDGLGHRAGDLLLMEVAARLQAGVRRSDILARVGGDEFALLVVDPDDPLQAAVQAAERILAALQPAFVLDRHVAFASCSIGIAQAAASHREPEALLRDADAAMYAAKTRAPGSYAVFDAAMRRAAVSSLALQTDLRHALARQEFHLDYQPVSDPGTRRLLRVEALLRWRHPTRGLVPPATFLPLAEEIGLIRDIGRWALHAACAQAAAWSSTHPGLDLHMSVNVSGVELRDPDFFAGLCAVLDATGLPARRLQLDITEGVFLQRPDLAGAVLSAVRATGVQVALDNFGTGYSSLGHLDRFEVDAIKLDRSLVARMGEQRRAMAILDGIVRLGLAMNVDVVAEGVETEDQLHTLRVLGCTAVQGYLLGQPMPPAELASRFGGTF
ncbi:MAG TPA: EAL domain-containing protein [Acetobacteraceae bacterium]